jgi:hypothetical protein
MLQANGNRDVRMKKQCLLNLFLALRSKPVWPLAPRHPLADGHVWRRSQPSPDAPNSGLEGIRMCSGVYVGILFAVCTVLLIAYKINKRMTIQMADELAERRKKFAPVPNAGLTP